MKRILFISHYAGLGGANLSMLYLICNLRKQKEIEPLVFLPCHGPLEQLLLSNGITYEVHKYASLRTVNRGLLQNLIEAVSRVIINIFQSVIIGFRLKRHIDLIHSNSSLVFFGIFLKFVMKKPLVWHLREFGDGDYNLIFSMGKRLSGWCYSKANTVIAISEAISRYYKSLYYGSNIVTIHNGVDETSIQSKFKHPPLPQSDVVKLCIVGGISETKNQIELINAVALAQIPNIVLDIIGDGTDDYVSFLKTIVRDNKLEKKVRFTGPIKNIGEILCSYDIGIITSKNEAFGRVTIEYMLAGIPVIASRSGANKELIEDGTTGLFYELGNANDLACKIKILSSNTVLRNIIAQNAYKTAINKYTAKTNAIKILKIYNNIANVSNW